VILVTQHDDAGQPATWMDLDTRVVHDLAHGSPTARPFTDQENAAADALVAALNVAAQASGLRTQLAAGVADIAAARAAADADVATALALRDQATTTRAAATTQRMTVAAWTPAATYRASDLTAVRDQLVAVLDRQALVLAALADSFTYRAAVDRNALITDDALLWLARLAAGVLDTQEA